MSALRPIIEQRAQARYELEKAEYESKLADGCSFINN